MFENAAIRRDRGTKNWFITTDELLGLDRVIFFKVEAHLAEEKNPSLEPRHSRWWMMPGSTGGKLMIW